MLTPPISASAVDSISATASANTLQTIIGAWKNAQREEGVSEPDLEIVENVFMNIVNQIDLPAEGRSFILDGEKHSGEKIKIFTLPEVFFYDAFKNIDHFELANLECLVKLPETIQSLRKIEFFSLTGCREMQDIPDALIDNNPNLQTFEVCGNSLFSIPNGIQSLRHLTRLDLSDNCLLELPNDIGALNNSLVRPEKMLDLKIGNNRFQHLPSSILNLTRWHIQYDDNPVCDSRAIISETCVRDFSHMGYQQLIDNKIPALLGDTFCLNAIDENNTRLLRSHAQMEHSMANIMFNDLV
jgi:hypothetical protein